VPAPPRVAFENINPSIMNRASRYVDVVKVMEKDGQAEVTDVCEAERYHFETTAAYCLQNGTGLQRSMINSMRDSEFMSAVRKITEQLQDLQNQNKDLKTQNEDLKKHVEHMEAQSKKQNEDLKQHVTDKLELLQNQNKDLKTQNDDLKKHVTDKLEPLEMLEKQVRTIGASLHNDRIRKRNNGTYAQFLKDPDTNGKLSIIPLIKEVQGQMDVTSLSTLHESREIVEKVRPLREVPFVGSKYSEGPSTWNDLFKAHHLDMLKMCQWYNDSMGIAKHHNRVQRQHVVAAWLSGRNLKPEEIANPASAAAESRASPSALDSSAIAAEVDSDQGD
jgi:hypothetical protein